MNPSDTCQYYVTATEQCARPVTVDFITLSDVDGEQHVTSNCARHSGPSASREAMARGIVRRERKGLRVVAS